MRDAGSGKQDAGSRMQEDTSITPHSTPIIHHPTLNSMSFKFEKLIVWQKAMEFGEDIYKLSLEFPKVELYNLSSQILKASDSIALNISEGSILQSNAEFKRFLGYSIRSLAEVVTCLHTAQKRKYINETRWV